MQNNCKLLARKGLKNPNFTPMLRSMTGYGRDVFEWGHHTVSVEIRSLNNKFLDLTLRLPQEFRYRDMDLRRQLQSRVIRGKVDLSISVESAEGQERESLNIAAITAYYTELGALSRNLHAAPADLLSMVMQLPNVTIPAQPLDAEALWGEVERSLERALLHFESFREQEGANLAADLNTRLQAIKALRTEIAALSPERLIKTRQRLEQQLADSLGPSRVDENRFEQELVYYLEKLDLNEELVRLDSHLNYFRESLDKGDAECGKMLGFIAQELGREINTLGSKANDATIQQLVVRMKDELEKIKEQALNVL